MSALFNRGNLGLSDCQVEMLSEYKHKSIANCRRLFMKASPRSTNSHWSAMSSEIQPKKVRALTRIAHSKSQHLLSSTSINILPNRIFLHYCCNKSSAVAHTATPFSREAHYQRRQGTPKMNPQIPPGFRQQYTQAQGRSPAARRPGTSQSWLQIHFHPERCSLYTQVAHPILGQ